MTSSSDTCYFDDARRLLSAPTVATQDSESPATAGDASEAIRVQRKAAVSVLFTGSNDEPAILMIRRSATGGKHRTEWAFPGGMVEATDSSLLDAALRETEEELGIGATQIEVWGAMPRVITGTGYEVYPFTGRLSDAAKITPEPSEVDDVVRVPISVLTDKANQRSITLVRRSGERRWDSIAYDGRIIWGASARILNRVLSVLSSTKP